MKKILTLDMLVKYCEENQFNKFSSKDSGYQLSVQIPACFESVSTTEDSLLYCTVKLMHTGRNRNGSYLTEKAASELIKNGFAYAPILANFTEDEDGNIDFTSHDMSIDENGNIEYIERQIGCFTTAKPYLEQDANNEDRQYIYAQCAIPVEYTKAAEIITRKNGTKVSAEIGVNEMSYDAKEKVLFLDDVVLLGATCLGVDAVTKDPVEEGMEGARLDIEDFAQKNNSSFFNLSKEESAMLIETLEKINETLSNFNIDTTTQKGGLQMTKFEELLEKYNKTMDDIDFDYESLTDEELEAKFEELFTEVEEVAEEADNIEFADEDDKKKKTVEGGEDDDDAEDEEGEDDDEEDDEPSHTNNSLSAESYSVHMSDGSVREFALSLQDRIAALETLVNDAYSESDNCWYTTIVYDKHVVMIDCWSGKAYRQEYKVRSDVYSLVGDRVSVHGIYVTDDEEKTLNELRGKFESAQKELNHYHKIEEDSEKKSIYASDEYRSIFDKAEYAEVNLDDYSVDELRNHLDGILLKYAKEGSLDFSVAEKEEAESTVKVFGIPSKKTRKGRYGSIFSKKN